MKDRDGEQVETVGVTARWIMSQPVFELGVADKRAGRPPRAYFDLGRGSGDGSWEYERGRAWATLAPRRMPLRIDGKLNPAAVRLYERAGDDIL